MRPLAETTGRHTRVALRPFRPRSVGSLIRRMLHRRRQRRLAARLSRITLREQVAYWRAVRSGRRAFR